MKRTLAFIICFMFMGIGTIFAEPLKTHTFELRPEISYIVYKEPEVMKEKGIMYGLVGSYTYHKGLMLKAEAKGSYGKLDYDGSTWGGTPLTIKHIPDYMLEFRGLGGYDLLTSKAIIITPYTGIGYRYLNDNPHKQYFGGYERESNYIYSPIGMDFIINFETGWSLRQIVEYDLFWRGQQKSHLSNVDPGLNDASNRQNKGFGLRGSITLQKKGKIVNVEVGPFIRYWNIKESKTDILTYYGIPVDYVIEPKNKSTEIGINCALKF
jgi:hypothetical protein